MPRGCVVVNGSEMQEGAMLVAVRTYGHMFFEHSVVDRTGDLRMRRLLRPLLALLLSLAFVGGGSASGVAQAAEGGSLTFSVDRVGTINRTTGLVTVTVSYSCTIPDGYPLFDQAEIQVVLYTTTGLQYAYIYIYPVLTCDGLTHQVTGVEGINLSTSRAGKVFYRNSGGYVIWGNNYGDFVQLNHFPISGSVLLHPAH